MYVPYLLTAVIFLGLIGLVSGSCPNIVVLSLILVAGGVSSILAFCGLNFLSLVLVLIYLGGMMVVFSYAAVFTVGFCLGGEWGEKLITSSVMTSFFSLLTVTMLFLDQKYDELWLVGANLSCCIIHGEEMGASMLYSLGSLLLVITAWVLLLVLLVVLKLVRGFSSGTIRGT